MLKLPCFQETFSMFKYLREVLGELKQVTWPKRRDVIKLTLVVIIISAVVGGYLSGLDYGFTKLLETIIKK